MTLAQVSFGYVWEYLACTELRLYCHVLNVTFSDFIGSPKNETADSAQPKNRSTVTRPLEGGVWGRDQTEEVRQDHVISNNC